nr:MAG TPA: NUMOD4 motif protein [Caudoviricetes sp.]
MEIWKDLTGYIGIYQISSNGRIKSLPRKIVRKKRASCQS